MAKSPSDINSFAEADRRQTEMLELLRNSSVDPIAYAGLASCGPTHCGRVGCSEACWFGAARRWAKQVGPIRSLLKGHKGPLHTVRVWQPYWGRQYGDLHEANIAVAKTSLTRIANSICDLEMVGVGMYRANPIGQWDRRWHCEIRAIFAGSSLKELDSAFSVLMYIGSATIKPITKLAAPLNELAFCKAPTHRDTDEPLDDEEFLELHSWLLGLKVGARLFRYGCDSDFEEIKDRSITWTPKVPDKKQHFRLHRQWKQKSRKFGLYRNVDPRYYDD